MTSTIPAYDVPAALARRAGVHRAVVVRLLACGALVPDGYLNRTDVLIPLLLPERAADVLRLQKLTRHPAPIA
jgi:hypothetical protein